MSFVGASLRSSSILVDKPAVLRLYKDLLRYSGKLQLTDKKYYLDRVQAEFRRNQALEQTKDIEFYYKVAYSAVDT